MVRKITNFFSRCLRKFKRMVEWANFSRHDNDFDEYYLFRVINFKLKQMKKCHENSTLPSTRTPDIIQEIDDCIKLTENIMENDYEEEAMRYLGVNKNKSTEYYSLLRKKLKDKDVFEKSDYDWSKFHKIREIEEQMLERDIKLLFSQMQKYIRGWWD